MNVFSSRIRTVFQVLKERARPLGAEFFSLKVDVVVILVHIHNVNRKEKGKLKKFFS